MGWYDTCKLVALLSFFFLSSIFLSIAQTKKGKEEKLLPPAYTVKGLLRTKIYYNYVLTDTTNVTRVYSDSSALTYKRVIKYYLTIIQPDFPENGFSKLDISVDSMYYYFEDGKEKYEFNSIETADSKVLNFEDFKAYSIPMSRTFTLVFSPYGEVAKVEGEQLLSDRNYIAEISTKTTDSILVHNWTDWLSDFALQHIGNIFKISYPPYSVYRDSLWETTMNIRIENLNITDTLEARVTGFLNNSYTIKANSRSIYPHPKSVKYFKINKLSLNSKINYFESSLEQNLSISGVVKYMNINTILFHTVYDRNEIFRQEISSNTKWELVNQYTFK